MRKCFVVSICAISLLIMGAVPASVSSDIIRIRGGVGNEFTDKDGNVWYPGQKAYDANDWGGWVGNQPQTASSGTPVVDNDTEYDDELFQTVSWQTFEVGSVDIDVNTGNGTFSVVYLTGEHWSGNDEDGDRGMDILIEDEVVIERFETSGRGHIDVLTFEDIEVKDGVMSIVIRGNPIEVGDDNPMFGGLVITKSKSTAVKPVGKLTVTWGEIK